MYIFWRIPKKYKFGNRIWWQCQIEYMSMILLGKYLPVSGLSFKIPNFIHKFIPEIPKWYKYFVQYKSNCFARTMACLQIILSCHGCGVKHGGCSCMLHVWSCSCIVYTASAEHTLPWQHVAAVSLNLQPPASYLSRTLSLLPLPPK